MGRPKTSELIQVEGWLVVWIQGVNRIRGIESAVPQEVVDIPMELIRA